MSSATLGLQILCAKIRQASLGYAWRFSKAQIAPRKLALAGNFSPQHLRSITTSSKMASLLKSQSYINGEWRDAKDKSTFEVQNPTNGQVIGTMADMGVAETEEAINAASDAFQSWRKLSGKERGDLLIKWNKLITENVEELARILSTENGKPLAEARAEVNYAASFLDWFAGEARRAYGDVVDLPGANRRGAVRREPIGVAGVIIPWNFPYAMVTRKLGAALAVGCTAVVKTPEDTPYSPTALAELAHQAGIPKGVINFVSCRRSTSPAIGKLMCENKKVSVVSFTGSTPVGALLMAQCAPYIKRVCLELGGLAPFIVFDSADLKQVKDGVGFAKFRCTGQTCINPQNFLLQEGIYESTLSVLMDVCKSMKLGDPLVAGTTVGPLINKRGLDKVIELVEDAKAKGAKVLIGGRVANEIGELFYEPTILTDVTDDMDIVHNEVFGPVLAVQRFKTEADALKIANQSDRGLAGYFFSQDITQCTRVSEELQCGLVGCNTGLVSATELPFGGYKQSGIGSESGAYGINEYLTIKAIATNINTA